MVRKCSGYNSGLHATDCSGEAKPGKHEFRSLACSLAHDQQMNPLRFDPEYQKLPKHSAERKAYVRNLGEVLVACMKQPPLLDWNGWEADPFPPRVREREQTVGRKHKMDEPGHVYLKRYALPMIDGLILVETGSTTTPKERISKLPCRAKWSAVTAGGRVTAERAFQALFDAHRLSRSGAGKECFLVPPSVLDDMVKALRQI